MNAQELESWLIEQVGHERPKPGLGRVQSLMGDVAHPKIVTVAGTNGKGETCLSLASLLAKRGVSYVLWTSPHILSITERFISQQGQISTHELTLLAKSVLHKARAIGVVLSYYEVLWLCFVEWAQAQKAQVWILEVGMGGRWDAVNSLTPSLTVVTSIARDHQEFLGKRYQQILFEKLGITRRQVPLVTALELAYLRELTERHCNEQQIPWIDLFKTGQLKTVDHFSRRNRLTAAMLDHYLQYQYWPGDTQLEKLTEQLQHERFTARGEVWQWGKSRWHFYGSHNVDGLRKFIQFLESDPYNKKGKPWDKLVVAFSQRDERDSATMLRLLDELRPMSLQRHFCGFRHVKAMQPSRVAGVKSLASWTITDEWTAQSIQQWDEQDEDILVTGSYYFVAHVQKILLLSGTVIKRLN